MGVPSDFLATARIDGEGLLSDMEGLLSGGTIRIIEELPPRIARLIAACVDEGGDSLQTSYRDFPENKRSIGALGAVGETVDVRRRLV